MNSDHEALRFEVAFSFAGTHRDKVRAIAEAVAGTIGRQKVFFDEWYEHEILGDNMDVLLQKIYRNQSLMVVVDLSESYADRPWTQAEARAVRALRFDLDGARNETSRLRLLNLKLGEGGVPGTFDTDAYLDGISKTASQCADVILRRLDLLKERLGIGAATDRASALVSVGDLSVNDSGKWVKIGAAYFQSENVRQASDGVITVRIPSSDAVTDAEISGLKPSGWRSEVVGYAFRHDALLVRVQAVENEFLNQLHVWSVTLTPENAQYGGGFMTDVGWSNGHTKFNAQQIAELRARRLLLGDSLQDIDVSLNVLIEGLHSPYSAEGCVFPKLYNGLKQDPRRFMEIARLEAIFALKASQVFEHVTELLLGPIKGNKMHVRCKGRRRQVYTNVPAAILEIEGECDLSK